MRSLFWLIAVALFLTACSGNTTEGEKKEKTPVITWSEQAFQKTSVGGCTDDSLCAVFSVRYPVFHGMDSLVARQVQRNLERVFSLGDPTAAEKSMKEVADEFVSSYKKFTDEFTGMAQGWYFNGQAKVLLLNDTLLSISIEEEYYTGGAHGGSERYFLNVDPRNGKPVTLARLFKPGFEDLLNSAAEAEFRKERELPDTASFLFNGFDFPEGKFRLNENYGFTEDGLLFHYNNYEIAPYAAGPTTILVPYKMIGDFITAKPVEP